MADGSTSHDAAIVSQISARLSLRTPQRDSLDILSDLCARIKFGPELDLAKALDAVQERYPAVEDFERDFPSLCFALATGVGKTRLMGAFVAFLALTGRSRNFFILAPNTTIYEKLVADFEKRTSPKYVFPGIAEFARTPPVIVTGDTWDRSAVFIEAARRNGAPIINIFNVGKIDKDKGRVKRLHEYIGESYFDWLAGLPDLVLLMDEAHRYRARAGLKAVAALKPILGLELTATPKTVGSNPKDFKNVIYRYGLAEALKDGLVKEPAVATRANFRPDQHTKEEIEKIKLEDGVHHHEYIKIELDIYARETGRKKVHPFMLVVAEDTTHASEVRTFVESDSFFEGRFKGKVAEVHSGLDGEETEKALEQLVALEHDARTEIVIHVNKLKEGWDVTNLYTIVPLRAFASDILTEQTLGRGLRLPYGTRTGNKHVDRLTVIAHDQFDRVIEAARKPGSIVMGQVTIGRGGDISDEKPELIEIGPIGGGKLFGVSEPGEQTPFDTEEKIAIGKIALDAFRGLERRIAHMRPDELRSPEVIAQIVAKVSEASSPAQQVLEGVIDKSNIEEIVKAVADLAARSTISIPEIVLLPKREVNFGYRDFDLDVSSVSVQPVSDELLIQTIREGDQERLALGLEGPTEARLEDYIVRHLMGMDAIDYDEHGELLYKLAGQAVARIRSYLKDDAPVENAVRFHARKLAETIYSQMSIPAHYWETPVDYEVKVLRSFRQLEPQAFNISEHGSLRDLDTPASPLSATRRYLFGVFQKCCYPRQRFQSDDERRFAILIDRHEPRVERWLKPGPGQFQIEYRSGVPYEPDFVVEADTEFSIVEIKADNEMDDPDVLAKSRAAVAWCKHASAVAADAGGKPWRYALVPASAVGSSATLFGLLGEFSRG